MYNIDEIKHIHLEVSSLCNARCPKCPRNFHGYPHNHGYTEKNLTLAEIKKIFSPSFVKQLNTVYINGNFGDAIMNPYTTNIIEYFRNLNKNLVIQISTNGSARNKVFWTKLAQLNAQVIFCLDGLEDTHHLYRQDTNWKKIIKNAQTFISAGGRATWKMIQFDHNNHQLADCRALSIKLGFKEFLIVNDGRDTGPVFDRKGNLSHTLGKPKETNFKVLFKSATTDEILLEDIVSTIPAKTISCQVKKQKSLYVSSLGDIYPCCYLGFQPKTYGTGMYHQAANAQFKDLIQKNNAIEYSLAQCITWFNKVEESWSKPSFETGRLIICDTVCGQNI